MEQDKVLFAECTQIMTKNLPVLRKICNLTQKELGDLTGVSRQTITNVENGKSELQWPLFLALMYLFSLDLESADYLKRLDIPCGEIKEQLRKHKRNLQKTGKRGQ